MLVYTGPSNCVAGAQFLDMLVWRVGAQQTALLGTQFKDMLVS